MESKKIPTKDFYQFLLGELKDFEKNFGKFIHNQVHEVYFENFGGTNAFNESYVVNAINTINSLCSVNNLTGIDTFNYSDFSTREIPLRMQHINGNDDKPIFGIDTIFKPSDEEFVFTKTSRRIDLDLFDNNLDIKEPFKNMVIFGHSLNSADYSYFFPMFDRLELFDAVASGVIVFAYSLYDKKKEEKIKSELNKSIFDLMHAYAESRKNVDANRFLDSLSTQKRILTYEIPINDPFKKRKSIIDEEWEQIYKEVDHYLGIKQEK